MQCVSPVRTSYVARPLRRRPSYVDSRSPSGRLVTVHWFLTAGSAGLASAAWKPSPHSQCSKTTVTHFIRFSSLL